MPSFSNVADLFKEVWNDLKEEGTANISTFFYFLIFLVFIIAVLSVSYYPSI